MLAAVLLHVREANARGGASRFSASLNRGEPPAVAGTSTRAHRRPSTPPNILAGPLSILAGPLSILAGPLRILATLVR